VSNKVKSGSYKERRASAQRPTVHVAVYLNGEIAAEIARLDKELTRLQAESTPDRFVGNPGAVALADRIRALQAQMTDEAEDFVLRAIPRRRKPGEPKPDKPATWADLCDAHPARPNNEADAKAGVNLDTFTEALLRLCVISPPLDDEDWDNLLAEDLTDAQYEELGSAAWALHQGRVSVPLSRAASIATRTSASN